MYELELEMCRELLKKSNSIKKEVVQTSSNLLEANARDLRAMRNKADVIMCAVRDSINSIAHFRLFADLDKYKDAYYLLRQKDGQDMLKLMRRIYKKLSDNADYVTALCYKRTEEDANDEIA